MSRPIGLTVVWLAMAGVVAAADNATVRKELNQLFELGWDSSLKARAAAGTQYEAVTQLAPTDQRLVYAYALVQIKQRRYPEAAKLIADVLSVQPNNVYAWRAKIWLSVITKNYAAALSECEKLAQLVPPSVSEGPKEERIREVATYLGRIYGYLDGPAADPSTTAAREKARDQILARLGEARQDAFEAGYHKIADQFATLSGEKTETEQRDEKAAEEERERKARELADKTDQITNRKDELGERRDKLIAEAKADIEKLEKQDRPLAQQQVQLETQALPVRNEWERYVSRIRRLQMNLDDLERDRRQPPDPLTARLIQDEIRRVSITANQLETQLLTFSRQRELIVQQRANLQAQALDVRRGLEAQVGRVDTELTGLTRDEKKVDTQKQRIAKPATGKTARVRALGSQVVAFTTYEEFPLEAEKQRLLDSYK